MPISAARVVRRAVPVTLEAPGVAEPLQTVAVQSQVEGVLQRVNFHEGDEVRAGQVLFVIDPRPYRAALDQAQAVLARDQAQLDNARADAKRFAALVAKEYVTPQQYEQTKTTAAALEATVAADKAAVETARLNLQYATIRAPITGRAGGLLVRPGNLVRANGDTPLVIINQIHPILVRFSVPATALPEIRRFQNKSLAVHARPTGDGPESAGTLTFVDNAVDTATGTILLKANFANANGALWPGEYVNVTLELYVEPDALVVPTSAVLSGQQGAYVFVVKPDRTTESRDVAVARAAGELTVLKSGVAPGDQVVTEGQLRLTPGAKVQIKPASGTAEGAPDTAQGSAPAAAAARGT
ncbi:MAG TPA: efflux RND transporter periplasmic adaptor subunit [Gemmatimonadales bacterium]|nr:efflux RND transporter periplasmic adaptor subunit [Gemmatimonadales bacterium]